MLKQIKLEKVEILDDRIVGCGTLFLTEKSENSNTFIMDVKKTSRLLSKIKGRKRS